MKNKLCATIQLCALLALFMVLSPTNAFAVTHNENDGYGNENLNGTKATAEDIKPNRSTLEGYFSGANRDTNYVVWGYLDKNFDDEDWFKVTLLEDPENIFSAKVASGVQARFRVYDDYGNTLLDTKQNSTLEMIPGGTIPYRVPIWESGVYYVQVTRADGAPAHETRYCFTIGDAMVDAQHIKVEPTEPLTLTLTPTQRTDSVTYDFNDLDVPYNAMVYTVLPRFTKSGDSATSLSYVLETAIGSYYLPISGSYNFPAYNNPLRDFWTLNATGNVRTGVATITPTFTFYYVYFVTPESLQ